MILITLLGIFIKIYRFKDIYFINLWTKKMTKNEKFIDLAEKRVNKTLNDLKLIRNLSNKNTYEYTDEQSKKIIRVLMQEIDLLKKSFQGSNNANTSFKL